MIFENFPHFCAKPCGFLPVCRGGTPPRRPYHRNAKKSGSFSAFFALDARKTQIRAKAALTIRPRQRMLNPKTEVHPMIWNHFEADRAALGTQYTEEHWDAGSGLSPEALIIAHERAYPSLNPAPLFSATLADCVTRQPASTASRTGAAASSAAAFSPSTIA